MSLEFHFVLPNCKRERKTILTKSNTKKWLFDEMHLSNTSPDLKTSSAGEEGGKRVWREHCCSCLAGLSVLLKTRMRALTCSMNEILQQRTTKTNTHTHTRWKRCWSQTLLHFSSRGEAPLPTSIHISYTAYAFTHSFSIIHFLSQTYFLSLPKNLLKW